MISSQSNNVILLTGATGWIGRTFLHHLQELIPSDEFNRRVYAFGSKPGRVLSTGYTDGREIVIPIYNLEEMPKHAQEKKISIIHTAFLTKDKYQKFGAREFVRINSHITEIVNNTVITSRDSRVVHMSSGAASIAEEIGQSELIGSPVDYGYLKYKEETMLANSSETQSFRIYGLSGRFIRDPSMYALGSFIVSALQKQAIKIKATNPVIRGYCNASDLAWSALAWMSSSFPPTAPLPSVSSVTSLKGLAEKITFAYKLNPPIISDSHGRADSYSYSPCNFIDFLEKFDLKAMTLSNQIEDTALGVKELIKS